MMTDTTGERRAQAARQIALQRRAAAALGKILERAAAEDLPPIGWTVATAGMELRGECLAHPMDARRDAFNTWRIAVGTWVGRIADRESERTGEDGTARLVDQWDGVKVPGVQGLAVIITLTADLYAED
jgi:hypothetical protein